MNGRFVTALSVAAGVGSLLLTFVLWLADQESKSLSLEVVSRIAISPDLPKAGPKIAVSIDGRVVEDAYISVVELVNGGTQPIVADDFEGAAEIGVGGAKLIYARVVATVPADLKPVVTEKPNAVAVRPLLLNSGDRVRISIVTNGAPTFSASARIAGVRVISISDDVDASYVYKAWRDAAASIALLILYAGMFFAWMNYRTKELRRWSLAAGAAVLILSYFSIISNYKAADPSETALWVKILLGIAFCIPVFGGGLLLVKTRTIPLK